MTTAGSFSNILKHDPPNKSFRMQADIIYLSRNASDEPLSSFSAHGFELDGEYWPTLEHYYQAMKFTSDVRKDKIRVCETAQSAHKLGQRWLWRLQIRKDWKKIRETVMTRGFYTKCRTHPEIAEKLLATGEKPIVENSQYDYYWGCGRDQRGHNTYGKMLMNVRNKLNTENTS